MAQRAPDPPLTEEVKVSCLFITGMAIEISRHVMRLIGYVHLPSLGGEADERRIVVRCVLPIDAAQRLRDDLDQMLG